MRISIGPIQYHWAKSKLDAFYQAAADSQADIVYLGETVCSKRREYRLSDYLAQATQLQAAGKEVVLSTLTLIEAESELSTLKRIIDNGQFQIEANDIAAVETLREWKLPFVAGPAINAYNGHSLQTLQACGMYRWMPPVELSGADVQQILLEFRGLCAEAPLDLEICVYGRLPLAYSARCFTARALNLPKDQCDFRCIEHPQGMPLNTQDGERLFTINGIQTQSGKIQNLCSYLPQLAAEGFSVLRVSPNDLASLAIVDALAHSLRSGEPCALSFDPEQHCDGYWRGEAGMLSQYQGKPDLHSNSDRPTT